MKKRRLEKVEALARVSTDDPPQWEQGAAADYLRELIGKAERGELPLVKRRADEPKSEAQLEFEAHIACIANRIRGRTERAIVMPVHGEGNSVNGKQNLHQQEDESPQELLARLWWRMNKTKKNA